MLIFLTGATGVMGSATVEALMQLSPRPRLRVLVRDSKKNRKKLAHFEAMPDVEILMGDLRDAAIVKKGVKDADIVLHVGGMVSPQADYHPELTMDVNIKAMRNIVNAALAMPSDRQPAVVYIGSVSQYGPREAEQHWCSCGDPMMPADHDKYALSKVKAERILADSKLKHWVSLRQTGILYPALLFNGTDPITFHVPLKGVLEWATVEDSARLMANLCQKYRDHSLPESFWRKFYNIGSGEKFRLTNYEFETQLMAALSCPPPEKVFETNWFATRNFHGAWFADSDLLESIIPFRADTTPEEYFKFMASRLPGYFKLAGIVPAALIKWGMGMVARKSGFGPLSWFKDGNEDKIHSYFKSREDYAAIPGWDKFDLSRPSSTPKLMDHGYDRSKPLESLGMEDMRKAAEFRGGKLLSDSMATGDLYTPLEWECAFGHRFTATPAAVLLGGHWCDECLTAGDYGRQASRNPFLAQAFLSTHTPDEMQ